MRPFLKFMFEIRKDCISKFETKCSKMRISFHLFIAFKVAIEIEISAKRLIQQLIEI